MKKSFIGFLIVIFFWLWFARPFFENWFIPTHDGEFHIIRIFEFSKMLSFGFLFPRWAPDVNSGYGMPLFIFHYPFPNYIGSLFHAVGATFIDSFQYALIAGYLLAMICCYLFCLKKTTVVEAVLATFLFATVPYWFVDINIRGSIGEVWGIAWIMAAMASIVWKKTFFFSLSIFLLSISHNIMAMLGVSFIGIYLFFFNRSILRYLLLGVFIGTYFWLPALAESRFMVGLNTVTYSDHFPSIRQLLIPSWGSVFSQPGAPDQEVSQQIGLVPLLLLITSGLFFWKQKSKHQELQFILIVSGIVIFLLTPLSQFVWQIVPPLQFLQYPWRLLSLIVIIVPFLAIFLFQRVRLWISIGIVVLSMVITIRYWQPVLYQPRTDEQYLTNPNFTDGTSSMGNSFSTIWTGWKSERPDAPATIIEGEAKILSYNRKLMTDTIEVEAANESRIEIQRLYYPGWKVFINGTQATINYHEQGNLIVSLPPGRSVIMAVFKETPLRLLANSISILAFAILVLRRWYFRYEHRH